MNVQAEELLNYTWYKKIKRCKETKIMPESNSQECTLRFSVATKVTPKRNINICTHPEFHSFQILFALTQDTYTYEIYPL